MLESRKRNVATKNYIKNPQENTEKKNKIIDHQK